MDNGSAGPDFPTSGGGSFTGGATSAGRASRTPRPRRYDNGGDAPIVYGDNLGPTNPFNGRAHYVFRGRRDLGIVEIPGSVIDRMARDRGKRPEDLIPILRASIQGTQLGVNSHVPRGVRLPHMIPTGDSIRVPLFEGDTRYGTLFVEAVTYTDPQIGDGGCI